MKINLILILLIFSSLQAGAITITWTGAVDNDWDDTGNWAPSQIPTIADDVVASSTQTINIPDGYNAFAYSLTTNGNTLIIGNDASLTVEDGLTSTIQFSAKFTNTTVTNNGNFTLYGGLWAEQNSNITNNGSIVVYGDRLNTPINFFFDTNTTLTNSSTGILRSINNKDSAGNRKDALIKLDNESLFDNNGQVYNSYQSVLADYLLKGVMIDNGSQFLHQGSFFNLNWVKDIGIEILNTTGSSTQSLFENNAPLRIRETTVDTDNASYAIYIGTNSEFKRLSGSVLGITYGPIAPGGFLNTTNQVEVLGSLAYTNTTATAMSFGVMGFSAGSTLAGDGLLAVGTTDFSGGSIAPGASPGIITFVDDYSGTSTFILELAGTLGAGDAAGHDQIVFQGATNDISNTSLDVQIIDGYVPQIGDEFVLISGAYTGTLSEETLPGMPSNWMVHYDANEVKLEVLEEVNLDFNINNVGVGTETPSTKLHVKDGDVYLETIGSGVIMKDANGVCYRVTVNTSGVLETNALSACPEE